MPPAAPTDSQPVSSFSSQTLVALALLAVGCTISVLYILATEVGHVTKVHDTKVRVAKLRVEYQEHLNEMANRAMDSDVIVLNEVPVSAAKPKKRAA